MWGLSMDTERDKRISDEESRDSWVPPQVIERGTIEAKLFSDEPDPWGP